MKMRSLIMIALPSLVSVAMRAAAIESPRLELPADSGWRFLLGDPSGAEAASFQDQAWRTVQLPHDWSIEGRPEKENPSGAGGGFFPMAPGGIARPLARLRIGKASESASSLMAFTGTPRSI